ncbi:hypothetical protein MBLNU457_3851t1 [Dothideomycetes sp. NU457]
MSSRALRKAQREKEEQDRLRKLEEEDQEEDEEDDEIAPARPTKSAFAMLDMDDEGNDDDEEPAEEQKQEDEAEEDEDHDTDEPVAPIQKSAPKRKKKKKTKGAAKTAAETNKKDGAVDDIDEALKSLSTKDAATATSSPAAVSNSKTAEVCKLLAVDTQHLHMQNEMRRLFGRAALDSNDDDDQGGAGRRRARGQQQQGLAAALGRRGGPQGGRGAGLGSLGLRRNIFIQGKEEWPVGTSGGLGMEIVEKRLDGTVEYRFVHNSGYQGVQSQFETCVASMDPQRMVQLLQYNPYHISTLLQVSEIAKQERDHSTSGDLLERALFSFGRAVHSTFANNLGQGKARLDFRRPENREFWLAANRYIANLSMRATWRTVYEWAKLLLSLDPEGDPYRMSLVIDTYALRARQPQQFVDLSTSETFTSLWKQLPNIQLSRGLAYVQAGNASKGKQTLYTAISRYPYVVARLFQDLNVDPPPSIWGKSPRTDWEKLHTELYTTRARDIWNTPEATNLLVEVASAVSSEVADPALIDRAISPDEGRHVLLTDKPELIALLPRSITSKITSSSDPLPPDDNLPSYTVSAQSAQPTRGAGRTGTPGENLRELQGLYGFFAELFPWFNPQGGEDAERPPEMNEEEIERRIAESGVSEEMIVQRTQRMMELQHALIGTVHEDPTGQHEEVQEEED